MDRIGSKWTEWIKVDQIRPNRTKVSRMYQIRLNGLKWTEVDRIDRIGPYKTKVD